VPRQPGHTRLRPGRGGWQPLPWSRQPGWDGYHVLRVRALSLCARGPGRPGWCRPAAGCRGGVAAAAPPPSAPRAASAVGCAADHRFGRRRRCCLRRLHLRGCGRGPGRRLRRRAQCGHDALRRRRPALDCSIRVRSPPRRCSAPLHPPRPLCAAAPAARAPARGTRRASGQANRSGST